MSWFCIIFNNQVLNHKKSVTNSIQITSGTYIDKTSLLTLNTRQRSNIGRGLRGDIMQWP